MARGRGGASHGAHSGRLPRTVSLVAAVTRPRPIPPRDLRGEIPESARGATSTRPRLYTETNSHASMLSEKTRWILLSGLAATGTAFVTRSLLRRGWHAAAGEDPPLNPASSETAWTEALVWTVSASVVAGLSRLTARRAAASLMDGPVPEDRYA